MRILILAFALLAGTLPAAARNVRSADGMAPAEAAAGFFAPDARWQTCFTPGADCTGAIVASIDAARTTIRLQAYEFTSPPIRAAIVAAQARGVDVRAILDRSQARPDRGTAALLAEAGIPVLIDARPAIAHNKVMVIDGDTVITGSFNFTRAAQARNAENVLIVRGDAALAAAYAEYWQRRESRSVAWRNE